MVYFIINPVSRSGKGKKIWKKIKSILSYKFPHIEYKYFISERSGDVKNIFEKVKLDKDIEKIVVVGGDGTINETINCLSTLSSVPIYCLPSGTSNDFIRSLHLLNSIERGLDKALTCTETVSIDSCRATAKNLDRLFVNGLGFGFDGEVVFYTENSILKKIFNRFKMSKLLYVIYGLKQGLTCKPFDVTLNADGFLQTFTGCYMLSAMINPFEGGGVYFAPKAENSDGLTNLIILHSEKNRWGFVFHALRALFRMPSKGLGYTDIPFKKAEIVFSSPQIGQIDGEIIGRISEITFESKHKFFKLIK